MLLMFSFLSLRGRRLGEEPGKVPNQIGTVADVLLKNLSLLFIPAATGIVQYFGLVKQFGWIIATSIAISTTAALIVTVMVFRLTAVVGTKRFARPAVREPSAPENEAP